VIPESTPVYTNRLQCVECGLVSGENESGWTAHLTDDEPEEVVVFSPECDERTVSRSAPMNGSPFVNPHAP
jgi:hypothetical protein